jgi:hypothetical protein
MPRLPAVLLSVTLGAAAAALVACGSGGGGSISATQAQAMLAQLSTAAQEQADGNCAGVQSAAKTLSREAGQIGEAKVRRGIQAGAANLHRLASNTKNCGETTTTSSSTTTTTTPTTSTTETTTRSTTTKPTTTTTKPTTTTPKPPPPNNGGISG